MWKYGRFLKTKQQIDVYQRSFNPANKKMAIKQTLLAQELFLYSFKWFTALWHDFVVGDRKKKKKNSIEAPHVISVTVLFSHSKRLQFFIFLFLVLAVF